MKQLFFLLITIVYIFAEYTVYAWSRPLVDVSHPSCKSIHRDEHPDFCKLSLPTVSYEEFHTNYKKDTLLPLIYSLPRQTPYKDNTALGKGSHPSLDIATAKGTPVYAAYKGKVVAAGAIKGYGNSITIQHNFAGEKVYTSYSHLDKILVSLGQEISEHELIGKVGNSGMSMGKYGNHLDFQISSSRSPFHPYGFGEFTEERYIDIVNKGLHQETLTNYTIDPVLFLDQVEAAPEEMRQTAVKQLHRAYTKIHTFFKNLAKTERRTQTS